MSHGYRAAQTICSDLLAQLNRLADAQHRSDFEIKRVEVGARQLKHANPIEFFMIQGICSALRGDSERVISCYEKAIALGGWTSQLASNYAVSLHEVGEIPKSWEVIDHGIETFPLDASYLSDMLNSVINTGSLQRAASIEDRLRRMNIAVEGGNTTFREYVEGVESAGVNVDLVGELIRLARTELRINASGRPSMFYCFSHDGGVAPRLTIGFSVNQSASKTRQLERDLHDVVFAFAESHEEERGPKDPSMMDFLTFFLRTSDWTDAAPLHAA